MVAESAFEPSPSIKAYSAFLDLTRMTNVKADVSVIGKDEPPPPNPQHHAHLTAMSITPSYRSLGLARLFMDYLEILASNGSDLSLDNVEGKVGEGDEHEENKGRRKDCVDSWFVDLFVRCNNHRAIELYEKLGYSVYRRVVE